MGEEQILGLHVAVDEDGIAVVQVLEGAEDVQQPRVHTGPAQVEPGTLAGQKAAQVIRAHELHENDWRRRRPARQ